MGCIVHPALDTAFCEEQVQAVEEKLEGEEMLEYQYIFVRGGEDCQAMANELELDDTESFLDACRRKGSSSFTSDGEEYLVISIDKPFLQENEMAAQGLIAHELIHTVQRSNGLEEEIEEAGQAFTDDAAANIMDRGFEKEQALDFIREVLSTAILALKDIHANTALIRQDFSEELEEYYYQMLDIEGYCPMPAFYDDEESLEDLIEAIAFNLRLLPAWLPFEGLDREQSQEIKERIDDCYKVNIQQTSYHLDKIRHLYHDAFQNTDEFNTAFFRQILDASYELIDEKLLDDKQTSS